MTNDDLAVLSQIKKHTREVSPYHLAKMIRRMTTDQVTKSCERLYEMGELQVVKGGRSDKYKVQTQRFFIREYLELYPKCTREQLYSAARTRKYPRAQVIYNICKLKKAGRLREVDGVLHYDRNGIDVKVMFNQLLMGVRNK